MLISIIEDLGIEEEYVALVECMADRSVLEGRVFQIISNLNLNNASIQNAVQEAINFACVCEEIHITTNLKIKEPLFYPRGSFIISTSFVTSSLAFTTLLVEVKFGFQKIDLE